MSITITADEYKIRLLVSDIIKLRDTAINDANGKNTLLLHA